MIERKVSELDGLGSLMILNPDRVREFDKPGDDWYAAVRDWVEEGGSLVVLVQEAHSEHDHNAAGDYTFGSNFDSHQHLAANIEVSSANLGSGKISVVVGSEEFSTDQIGHCMALPTSDQRESYTAAYELFALMGDTTGLDRRSYLLID